MYIIVDVLQWNENEMFLCSIEFDSHFVYVTGNNLSWQLYAFYNTKLESMQKNQFLIESFKYCVMVPTE